MLPILQRCVTQLRLLIFALTLNSGILVYGVNNNISLSLHSLKKMEFHIADNYKVFNKEKNNQIENVNEVWVFGGSTSNSGFCDSKNLSWVDLLDINLRKINFSRNGVSSKYSLNVLKSELQKNDPPKAIIWANKVNELTLNSRYPNPSNSFFYFINSLKLSIKKRLVSFYFFDEITLRIFDKLKIDIRYNKKSFDKSDYISASESYFNNSRLAIKLAKLYKVENFYIVSLFNRDNLFNSERKFFNYYYSKILDLIRLEPSVKFFNTKNYIGNEHINRSQFNYKIDSSENTVKKKDIYKKPFALFCDSMHQTFEGKVITAKIISDLINGKK